MHILVTDILSCPRCGPEFGLILLAERITARRVLAGSLACPNCRQHYPVHDGYAALMPRASVAGTTDVNGVDIGAAADADRDAAAQSDSDAHAAGFRLLALLGLAEGPANALLVGGSVGIAQAMAAHVAGLEVITAGADAAAAPEAAGVTRIGIAERLPFHARSLHGVVLMRAAADALLEEGARVVKPLGRVVLEAAPSDAAARLERAGLRVIAADAGTFVAQRG